MEAKNVSLPYIDNTKAVLVTIAVNIGVVFLFNWPGGIDFGGVLADSVICAAITTVIDLLIVYPGMKKLRAQGMLPSQVPVSRFMQWLPQNPFALGVIYAVAFGVLTMGINALILWFFGMPNMAFWPWMAYKLIYATVLSIKITEYCIFRYVQPDWAHRETTRVKTEWAAPETPVKNPLPKISVFREMFGSVTMNIAMNIIIGTALGGVVVGEGGAVVIYPTTVQGIPITGLIFGFISGVLVTNGVIKEINSMIRSSGGGPADLDAMPLDKRFSWMPVKQLPLTVLVCACTMAFSAVALWGIMMLFGIEVMNFYQFTVFITVYAAILAKPLSALLVRRCTQPDYIRLLLNKPR